MSARALYIHVPFCSHRCDYCDFFTRTGVSGFRQRAVLHRIADQIAMLRMRGSLDTPLASLYIGGGTPSALAPEDLDGLLDTLQPLTSSATEWTVELNPEHVSQELLFGLLDRGVNRLSLGVQSLDGRTLERLGRGVNAATTQKGLQLVSRNWPARWTADLITAIPGGTAAQRREDAARLLDYGPGHLSVYELGIEARTRLGLRRRRGDIAALNEQQTLHQLAAVAEELDQRGLFAYEVSSFSRPGEESRHNRTYWRLEPWAAAGPAAVGLLPGPAGPEHLHGPRDFARYLERADFGVRAERLSTTELLEELLMGGLRTLRGVDSGAVHRIFGSRLPRLLPRTLDQWNDLLVWSEDGFLALNAAGRQVLDAVLVDAFREIEGEHQRLPDRPRWPDPRSAPGGPDRANTDSTET